MNKLVFKLFKKQIISLIISYLDKTEIKEKWVSLINKKVNIPNVDEQVEGVVFRGIIDAGFDEIKTLINEIGEK